MKIFQSNLKLLQIMGITSFQSIQSNPFNIRNVVLLSIFVSSVIMSGGFLFYTANDFSEYTESFYVTSTLIVSGTVFVNFVLNMRKFFQLVNSIEDVIQKSEHWPNQIQCFECYIRS